MSRGRFITLEGGEGTGKSTQVARLAARLRDRGIRVVETREPGGSEGAEAIRALLLTGDPERWDAVTEALLLFAARRDHVERTIRPALERGEWVVSDRFADSTMAYQGAAHGLGPEAIRQLWKLALDDFMPDLTIVLDLPVEQGLERANAREGTKHVAEDRYERMSLAFHQALRQAFLDLAAEEPERCVIVSAEGSADEVQEAIWSAVTARLEV